MEKLKKEIREKQLQELEDAKKEYDDLLLIPHRTSKEQERFKEVEGIIKFLKEVLQVT